MRIYIASKYQKHTIINREITDLLTKNGFEVFLPESINNNGIGIEQMKKVGLICYKEIEKSDVLLVVSPYKRSVSAEIGYAIRKKLFEKQINIILFRIQDDESEIEDSEAMIVPFLDYFIDDYINGDKTVAYKKLLDYLFRLNNSKS